MDITAKKSLGQHFLTNPKVSEWMCEAGAVRKGETVLEIGPGTGALTKELLARGAKVIAVEADVRAVAVLKKEFAREIAKGNFALRHADIREFDIATLPLRDQKFKVIANIPYYISGMLFEKLLAGKPQPNTLVFLIQKEVAERIARSKKESLFSLSVKVFGTPKYVRTVKKGNFTPSPKVDSAILAVTDISRKDLKNGLEPVFFDILRAGFAARRKQLPGNLTVLLPREVLIDIFSTLGIDQKARGEDLSVDIWLSLAKKINDHTLYKGVHNT